MTEELEQHRRKLLAIAYRMTGSLAEAEDVVQDAWLRWRSLPADAKPIREPVAWFTTIVTRLCLDRLKSAHHQREKYVGPWLPEPVATQPDEIDPESVSIAFMLLLERLTPVERAVYLLHRVFDFPHAAIATTLEISPDVVRQSMHRANEHVAAARPRFAPSKTRHQEMLIAFASASQRGDLSALLSLLATDAKAWTDGGGKVRAVRNMLDGNDAIARFFVGVNKKTPQAFDPEIRDLNGAPSLVLRQDGVVVLVMSIETDGEHIHGVHINMNPDKLAALTRH